jgi:protein MpaA
MNEAVRRLGKNLGGYFGETIDIAAILEDCTTAARKYGWSIEDLQASPTLKLLTLKRGSSSSGLNDPRLYISAGIHGDEPAGPLAVRQLLAENAWPANLELWICPCLNPVGFTLNSRTNAEGLDLNRQYRNPAAPETKAHIAWLDRQPNFDFCLCLHEDWESHGFYLFEVNPEQRPSYAPAILEGVSQVCPIDRSDVIEGWEAKGGIIRPNIDAHKRPDWPEGLFLIANKTRMSCTLEAPSDFPLPTRVAALVAGVRAGMEAVMKARSGAV